MNILFLFYVFFFFSNANAQLQNEDFSSVAQMEARGLNNTQAKNAMLHDTKVYVNSLSKLLSEAIADGDIGDNIMDLATTEGDLIYFDGTDYQRLARGQAGQVLTATASSIEYADQSGGAETIAYFQQFNTSIDSWTSYADAAGVIPVDMTGGSPVAGLCTQETASPLFGAGSLKITKGAVNIQGQGCSRALVLDSGFAFKLLRVSIEVDASDADYQDDDLGFYIYDSTNSNLIRFNREEIRGGRQVYVAQFQTTNSLNYTIGFHVRTDNSVRDWSVLVDDIAIKVGTVSQGVIVTDPVVETFSQYFKAETTNPTLATTKIFDKYSYYRQGKYLIVEFQYRHTNNAGTNNGSGNRIIELPSGLEIDTSIIAAQNNRLRIKGGWTNAGTTSGIANSLLGAINYHTSNSLYLLTMQNADTQTHRLLNWNDGTVSVNQITDAELNISGWFEVPILGWSSNSQMSETGGNREVYLESRHGTSQTLNDNITSFIAYDTIEEDSTNSYRASAGAFNSATGEFATTQPAFVVPETGLYYADASIMWATAAPVDATILLRIYESNGSAGKIIRDHRRTYAANNTLPVSGAAYLVKGQEIRVQALIRTGNHNTAVSTSRTRFQVFKIASPQTIFPSEKVVVLARNTSNQGIPDNTATNITGWTEEEDSHGWFNPSTGVFTAGRNVVCGVSCTTRLVGFSGLAIFTTTILGVNGSDVHQGGAYSGTMQHSRIGSNVSTPSVRLNVGDQLVCRGYHTSGATRNLSSLTTSENVLTINCE
jgi:hypothetical protein